MSVVEGHRFLAFREGVSGIERASALPPCAPRVSDTPSVGANQTPADLDEHRVSDGFQQAHDGDTRLTAGQSPSRPRKPPKARPHTRCELCERVGRAETFIRSSATGKHYCSDTIKCDKRRKRGAANSRKAS